MRRNLFVSVLLSGALGAGAAFAQLDRASGVTSFQQDRNAWRRQDSSEIKVLQSMSDSLGKAAMDNVTKAEQAFCYEVANKPADYSGYTLDGMAVTGFCGVINEELRRILATQFFATAANISNATEQCVIRPKLIIRFVRGVDYTDVLVSAPCHSIAVFYGGKVKTYNFKPGAELLDVMVSSFAEQRRDFVSPSLLNQLLPIGIPQTAEQQKTVRAQATQQQPVRNWEKAPVRAETRGAASPAGASPVQTKQRGWNNLKVNVQ